MLEIVCVLYWLSRGTLLIRLLCCKAVVEAIDSLE